MTRPKIYTDEELAQRRKQIYHNAYIKRILKEGGLEQWRESCRDRMRQHRERLRQQREQQAS